MIDTRFDCTLLSKAPNFSWFEYDKIMKEKGQFHSSEADRIKKLAKQLFEDLKVIKSDGNSLKNLKQRISDFLLNNNLDLKIQSFIVKAIFSILINSKQQKFIRKIFDYHGLQSICNDRLERIIHEAIRRGEQDFVKALLTFGFDPGFPDKNQCKTLHYAAFYGHKGIVQDLLDYDAYIDSIDVEGMTPANYAVREDHLETLQLLLRKGAMRVNENGATPLHIAAAGGSLKVMNFLLKNGVHPDIKNEKYGNTPLFPAAANGKVDALKLLVASGANIHHKNHQGHTSLDIAGNYGQFEALQYLLGQKMNPNCLDKDENNTLHTTMLSGNMECIKLLLDHNAKTDWVNSHGQTPALLAKGRGFHEAEELLKKGLDAEHQALEDHKMLCHRFGFDLSVPFGKKMIDLSGFLPGNTYPELLKSFQTSTSWLKEAPPEWNEKDDNHTITQALLLALTLLTTNNKSKLDLALKAYHAKELVILSILSQDHANSAIFFKTSSKNYCFKGDKALIVKTEDSSIPKPGLLIYEMNNENDLKDCLEKLTSKYKEDPYIDPYIFNSDLDKKLGLKEPPYHAPRALQHGNGCAWSSSAKMALYGAILAQLVKKGLTFESALEYGNKMYKAWAQEDRLIATKNYLETVPSSDIKTTVLACVYKHMSNKKTKKEKEKDSNNNQQAVIPPYIKSIMDLIEEQAPEAITLSSHIEFTEGRARKVIIV